MKHNDANDAAFPMPHHPDLGGGAEGLTTREYYAAQALSGIIVAYVNQHIGMPEAAEGLNKLPAAKTAAQWAFDYADAMLGEAKRDRTKDEPPMDSFACLRCGVVRKAKQLTEGLCNDCWKLTLPIRGPM